jgi:exosortase/archaeosortase family protein
MAIFPLAVLKNGFRIAVLSWLGLYVSPAFLHGSLHRDGGFLFFTLALLLLIPIIRLLQKAESTHSVSPVVAATATPEIL